MYISNKVFLIYIDFVQYINGLIYFILFIVPIYYNELIAATFDSAYSITRLYLLKMYAIMFLITIAYLCYYLFFKLELNTVIKKSVNLQFIIIFFSLITNLIILEYCWRNLNLMLAF